MDDERDLTLFDSPHALAQPTGAMLMTGTSGSVYNLLDAAEAANEQWGAGLDLRWIRLAAIGWLLANRHHTLHEVLAGAQLWAREPGHPERRALGFDYDDSVTRYNELGPLSEEELREGAALGGRFPDERVHEFYTGSTPGLVRLGRGCRRVAGAFVVAVVHRRQRAR
ncbi:hypothetical protein NKH77_28815 [Streptomyces sp. M19]